MSFDTLIAGGQSLARVIAVEMSTDNWATTSRRWADIAVNISGNWYESRIVSLGNVKRALGQDRIVASSSTQLVLDNADTAIDFLCGASGISLAAKLRVRISLWVYDPSQPFAATAQSKILGEFICSEWPRKDYETVTLTLNDDVLGRIGECAQLPTIADWAAVGNTTNNPLFHTGADTEYLYALPSSIAPNTPIQLAFGEDYVRCLPHILVYARTSAGNYDKKLIIPVCSTTDTSGTPGGYSEIAELRVELYSGKNDGSTVWFDVPKTQNNALSGHAPGPFTNWYVERSPVITKAGKSFRIIYLVLDAAIVADPDEGVTQGDLYRVIFGITAPTQTSPVPSQEYYSSVGGYSADALWWLYRFSAYKGGHYSGYAMYGSRLAGCYVKSARPQGIGTTGAQLSARTVTRNSQQHAADVISDLVLYYAQTSLTVDTTMRARIKAGTPNARAFGLIQPWTTSANNPTQYTPPQTLRQALTQLAQSSDIDVFINWSGQLSFAADIRDYTTDTGINSLVDIDYTLINDLEIWVPSNGERGAPYNQISFIGGRADPATDPTGNIPFQGPWTADSSWAGGAVPSILPADRIIAVQLQQGWRPFEQQLGEPWKYRALDFTARERIRFKTNIVGLRLELGQYFTVTKRSSSITTNYYQCEAIAYAPGDDSVEIEAIQRNDVATTQSYLLDDEALLIRTKNVSGQTASVDDTSNIVNFSGTINLTTMGVVVGDILVIRDSTAPLGSVNRNKAVRISAIVLSTRLGYASPLGPIDATSTPFAVADSDWYIIRGATTGPTAISDPTNYPNGSTIYGKMTDTSGQDSFGNAGNQLFSG